MSETHQHEHKSLREEIADILNLRKTPEFSTYSAVKQFGLTVTELLEAGCELAHTVKDSEALIGALEETWDKDLVKIDLPINDALEFTLEMAGRQLIRPVITAIYQRLENPPAAT